MPQNEGQRERARRAVARTLAAGAKRYDRQLMLPRLIAAAPADLAAASAPAAQVVKLLARALRRERALGRAGHWAYDLGRHIGLAQANAAERAAARLR
jgi:hypothetical protein